MLQEKLLEILKETFGHEQFRLKQKDIIHSVLEGNDVLAIMPTGGGKSVCYQIPALYSDGVCVVVSPLISLMYDQVSGLHENAVEACFLNSNQTYEERKKAEEDIKSGKVKLVYISPEGLMRVEMLNFFSNIDLSLIAIDEAHCVSQWGHEFRSDYKRLGELKEWFPNIPIMALTATADERTRTDIIHSLGLNDPKTFISSFDRPNIKYSICERQNEMNQLVTFIDENHKGDTGIVYCLSRKKVEKVTRELRDKGYDAFCYHAGLSSEERSSAQDEFNKRDGVIIVATIAFGMGIDKPDVRFVAHLDLPKSVEGYYQETGRAGRDGLPSNAWMVYGLQDIVKLSQMLEKTDAHETYKKVARFKLDAMLSLCESPNCRRQILLQYFGEESSEYCGNCDSCLEPGETWDATVDAQKVLSTIFRTGQVFGANHIIDVIRGSKGQKISDRGHDKLSVFGIGQEATKQHWNSVIRQLLHLGFIYIKDFEYRSLALSQKSLELLKGKSSLSLRKKKGKISKKAKRESQEVGHERVDLFEELRKLRRELAEEKSVPPYVIFADKSLHDMCLLMPRNNEEFLMVNGVGKSKQEKYGEIFLKKIKEFHA